MTMNHGYETDGRSTYQVAIEKLHDAKMVALRKRLAVASTSGEKAALKKRIAAEIQDYKRKVAEIRGILF